MQMPIVGMRVFGDYVFGGEVNPGSSNNIDLKFSSANGYRVGVGMRALAVSVNLEYENLKYGKTTLEKLGPFTSNTGFETVKLTNNSWILSVSFPLEL
jgi:hypothetical protein